MISPYKNRQRQNYLFCILHKYIQHSIIEQGKSKEIKTKLKQVATSFEIVLVLSKEIKTKHSYILATRSKTGAKLVLWSLDKRLSAHHIVYFVNWKRKAEFCSSSNQVAQTQNQNSASNANIRLSKPNTISTLDNKSTPSSTKCFNCQKTGHYSRNCPNLENKRVQSSKKRKF